MRTPIKHLLLSASAAALLLSSASAFADHDHGKHDRRGDRHAYRHDGHHDNGLHLGQRKQAWRRGERLPAAYLVPRYYVEDYRAYRLAPPPRGYVWVRPYPDSRQYLLVQAATGLISQILGN